MGANGEACPQCGTASEVGTKFCGQCGYDFDNRPAPAVDPKRTALGMPAVPLPEGFVIGGAKPADPVAEAVNAAKAATAAGQSPGRSRDFAKTMATSPPEMALAATMQGDVPLQPPAGPISAPALADAQQKKSKKKMNRTMLGMPASALAAGAPAASAPAASPGLMADDEDTEQSSIPARIAVGEQAKLEAEAPAPKTPKPTNRTMLGMPATDLAALAAAAPSEQAGAAAQAATPASNVPAAATNRTMLGMVAAPVAAPAAPAAPAGPTNRTMLGMAATAPAAGQPGAAPAAAQPGAPTPTAPATTAPATTGPTGDVSDVSIAGLPSTRKKKSGAGAAIGVVFILLALGAAGVGAWWWLTQQTPEVRAAVITTESGEALQIEVPSGEAGTKVRFGGQEQALEAGRAQFALGANDLQLGDNTFNVDLIDADGGATTVPILLVQRFRVRPDLAGLSGEPPTLRVVVDAIEGSSVTIDGEVLALDATGHAVLEVPIADQEGAFEHSYRYRIVPPEGNAAEGAVDVVIPFASLQIDRPARETVTDAEEVEVAGASHPEASVTVNGTAAEVRDGRFLVRVPLPELAEQTVVVVASREGRVPRTVRLQVRRVADLAREAASYEFDRRLTYARIAASPEAYMHQRVAFEGRVYNAGTQDGHSMVQILVRDCAAGQRCPLWVNYDGASPPELNQWVRVLGEFAGEQQYRTSGGEVKRDPRVDAAFLLPLDSE